MIRVLTSDESMIVSHVIGSSIPYGPRNDMAQAKKIDDQAMKTLRGEESGVGALARRMTVQPKTASPSVPMPARYPP
ncbi:MAG: hypothetical protein BWY66_02230 [bacterium ADurb.Bin374]|nr:MAG: hypothetical protein BWY66_02230 [bacterium ADurb.Bin374]